MDKKYNKGEKIGIIMYLLTMCFIGIGATFAYLSVSQDEEDAAKVYAGRIDVNYIDGNEVSADLLYPISEPEFNNTKNVYRKKFGIRTEGTLEQLVSVDFQVTNTEFNNNSIKYALYTSEGRKLATGYINGGVNNLTKNLYFKPTELKEYVLILWLDENGNDQNEEQNKKLAGTIIIDSVQIKN